MQHPPAFAVPAPPGPQRRRRFWIAVVAIVAALAASAALLVAFGPQLVARQVVRTYLDGLNIDTSGVDTLRFRPLQGYLSFGPVTFRGADAVQGQVGRIGVKIDVTRLLRRQALVETIAIEGVRFEVRQAPDGAISLNGIPLTEILAESADAGRGETPAPEAVPPAAPSTPMTPRRLEEELGWGAGLDSLQIRDSRVVFINARGGEAVMEVHQLDLGGFSTWAPDRPGHYRLDAELNEVRLTASGIAKPFAEKIELEAEAAVSGIEVTKIERFLGPLGFTSRAGEIDLAVHDVGIAVFAAGQVDARLAATGTLTGVDLAHPLFGRGQLAAGTLRLDNVTGTYDATGDSSFGGDVGIDLQASELRLDDGTEVGFSRVTFGLPGTTVRMVPDQQPVVRIAPELDIADLRLGGADIQGTVGNAAVRLSGFSIEGKERGAPFFATGSVAVERVALLLPKAEPLAIAADSVRVDLAETRLAFPPGRGPQIAGGIAFDTRQLALSTQQTATGGRPAPPPAHVDAARITFEMPTLTFDGGGGTGMTVNASGPLLSVDDLRLSGPDVRGSVGRAAFRLSSFAMAGAEAGSPMVATGNVAVDRLDLFLPDVEPVAVAAEQLRAELAETRVSLAPSGARVEGGLALDTRELLVSIQEQARRGGPLPPPTRIEAGRFALDLPKLAMDEGDPEGAKVRAGSPLLTLDRLRLGGPDIQGTIANTVIRLSQIDVEAAAPGAPFVATGTVAARRLDLIVPDIEPIGINAQQLDARLIGTRFAFPSGRVLIKGAVALDTRQLLVSIHQQGRDGGPRPPPIRIAAARFDGEIPSLIVDDSRAAGTKVGVVTPSLTLDQFRLDAPTGPGAMLHLAAPTLTLRRVDVDVIDAASLEVSGQANVSAADLTVTMPPEGGAGTAPNGHIAGLKLDLRRFSYREAGEMTGFGMVGRIDLDSLRGRLAPEPSGRIAGTLALSGLGLDVADVDVSMGGGAPEWRARLDLDLASIETTMGAPLPLIAKVGDVSLRRLAASSAPEYGFDTLTIGRFEASVRREAGTEAETPRPAKDAAAAARVWPPADLPAVHIGRFGLIDGGRIALLDETVTPAVIATLDIDTLDLENVDTTNPDARTDLSMSARLGESAIRVAGWAEAFRATPSFELQAEVDALPLPTISPYFAPRIGLDVFKGHLSIGATGVVTAGQLDGRVQARIAGARASDRPNADTDHVSRSIGLPLSTLIALLEDRDGAIDITLPVSGDILAPEFDTSGVIWGMVSRALRALVRSPVRFISATSSLIAASRDGAGAAERPDAVASTGAAAGGD